MDGKSRLRLREDAIRELPRRTRRQTLVGLFSSSARDKVHPEDPAVNPLRLHTCVSYLSIRFAKQICCTRDVVEDSKSTAYAAGLGAAGGGCGRAINQSGLVEPT